MLARAPPPSINFPARNKVCNRREIVRLFRKGGGGRGVVVTRAGFTRRPLETSCSYEVVNDSTEDGFIVIRAENQVKEFYPPPPSDLLSSIPSESARRNGSRSRGVTASFGRLKAQKVKALVGKVTQKKQHVSHNEEEDEDDASDEDLFEDEGFGSSSILDLMRKKLAMKAVPRSGNSLESKEVKRSSKMRESRDVDRLEGHDEDIREVSNRQNNERARSRSLDSNGSAANSRGRGDRLSVTKDLDTFKGHHRAVGEVSNPRKFTDNERAEPRSSYSKGSAANSKAREDRRFVTKELDTYQGRDRATDEFSK